jgi:hypothetical protein
MQEKPKTDAIQIGLVGLTIRSPWTCALENDRDESCRGSSLPVMRLLFAFT